MFMRHMHVRQVYVRYKHRCSTCIRDIHLCCTYICKPHKLSMCRKLTSEIMKIAINRPRDLSKRIQHALIYIYIYIVKSNLSLVACIWSHFMKNYFFGIQNHEKKRILFTSAIQLPGGSAPRTPRPNFGPFFKIFPKSCFWIKKVTVSLKNVIFLRKRGPRLS